MKEDKRAGAFIPCGDSMEKMSEIKETDLEKVSGGIVVLHKPCPQCGRPCSPTTDGTGYICYNCRMLFE